MSPSIAKLLRGFAQGHGIESTDIDALAHLRYCVHGPMVLFRKGSFETDAWLEFLGQLSPGSRAELWSSLARDLRATHLAVNADIPREDTMRRPEHIKLLYGDFGTRGLENPSQQQLDAAFWVTVKQDGVWQSYAPLYTMFSRGNLREKLRIRAAASDTGIDIRNASAVDLYAGIGYFALQYAAAGASRVFCWEINPWSVEGLRRGAMMNKFKCEMKTGNFDANSSDVTDKDAIEDEGKDLSEFGSDKARDCTIIVYAEDNIAAGTRLKYRHDIRHINLGMLPSSERSWGVACDIVAQQQRCCVHVHWLSEDLTHQSRSAAIVQFFADRLGDGYRVSSKDHFVKDYAPKVRHLVQDVMCERIDSITLLMIPGRQVFGE